jgi:hypothetical protein
MADAPDHTALRVALWRALARGRRSVLLRPRQAVFGNVDQSWLFAYRPDPTPVLRHEPFLRWSCIRQTLTIINFAFCVTRNF